MPTTPLSGQPGMPPSGITLASAITPASREMGGVRVPPAPATGGVDVPAVPPRGGGGTAVVGGVTVERLPAVVPVITPASELCPRLPVAGRPAGKAVLPQAARPNRPNPQLRAARLSPRPGCVALIKPLQAR